MAALAFLAGEGGSWEKSENAKRQRLLRLRQQIAATLAEIDRPDCVPVLTGILMAGLLAAFISPPPRSSGPPGEG